MNTRRPLTDAEMEMAGLLGKTVREQRITQEQLAARLGVTQGVVWQWINGRIAISPEKAVALAEILGLEPGQLSARITRLVEGKGNATLKFGINPRVAHADEHGVREAPAASERPALARLMRAIASADAAGSMTDAIAASLAALIESLPRPATGGQG